jgi:hypothetical protein
MVEAAGALETIAESNQLFSTVSMLVQLSNQPHKVSHIVIKSFGASHQIKMFAMARVEHKGPPMPFMGPLGGPEYAAANPSNLHCHCALAYPG